MMPLAYIYCEQYWMERPETRVKNGNDVCETFCHVKSGCEGPLACTVNNSGWRDVRVGWKKPWHEWNILCYSQLWCEGAFSMYFAMFSKQNTHTHTRIRTHTHKNDVELFCKPAIIGMQTCFMWPWDKVYAVFNLTCVACWLVVVVSKHSSKIFMLFVTLLESQTVSQSQKLVLISVFNCLKMYSRLLRVGFVVVQLSFV